MPQQVNQHQQASPSAELRGFQYTKVANVAALPATGQAGEIVTVTATGVDYQWNQVLGVWVPWHNDGTVLRSNITGAATANVAGRGAAELTLTGNATGLTISGWSTDTSLVQRVRFQIRQDNTGGRTFAWGNVNGTWLETPPATLDLTAAATSLQFYAITTDGGATVWLEPIGIAYTNPCVYMQLVETAVPAVAAGDAITLSHSYSIVYGVELVEVATGRRVQADWSHVTPGDESSDIEVDFTLAHPANTYVARVAGLADTPCQLSTSASEWVSVQLSLDAATTIAPNVVWTGPAGSVQWVWGDGSAPQMATSGVATTKTYGSAFTGNATLRWRRGTTITSFISNGHRWSFNVATAAAAMPSLTVFQVNNSRITGDIAPLGTLTGLTSVILNSTLISGSLASLSGLTGLTVLRMENNPPIGGPLSAISGLTALTNLQLASTGVTGNINAVIGATGMATLNLGNTAATGNIADFAIRSTLTFLAVNDSSVAGNVTTLITLTNLRSLFINSTAITGDVGVVVTAAPLMQNLTWRNMTVHTVTAPEEDAILATLAAGTVNGGFLDIKGSNPAIANIAARTTLVGRGWTVLNN